MKSNFIVGVTLAMIFGIAIGYQIDRPSASIIADKARCAEDGENYIQTHFQDIPPDTFTAHKEFAYSTKLDTCLLDIQRDTPLGIEYSIYDIYSDKQLVSYSLNKSDLGLPPTTGSSEEYIDTQNKYFSE
jgi:hypothetical protein